jgi:polyphosphate kinase
MDREIEKGKDGFMFFKMNSFTDKDIIKKLRDASRAGVTVKMVIRGITCLVPGLKDETENVEIRSIVGRYLEHSRIYIFGRDEDEKMYIASADFMTRNTERRVEVGCPIYSAEVQAKIHHLTALMWADNMKARRLQTNGRYQWIRNTEASNRKEEADSVAAADTAAKAEGQNVETSAETEAGSVPDWLTSMMSSRSENRGLNAQDAQMELAVKTGYLPGGKPKQPSAPRKEHVSDNAAAKAEPALKEESGASEKKPQPAAPEKKSFLEKLMFWK